VFLEPKDPVRLRWLGEQIGAGRLYTAFLALDCWMLSYGASLLLGLVVALSWAGEPTQAMAVLAMLGFLTRDIAIFLTARFVAGPKGDFAALAILAALYLLMPTILRSQAFLFLPLTGAGAWPLLAAWAQAAGMGWWALDRLQDENPPP